MTVTVHFNLGHPKIYLTPISWLKIREMIKQYDDEISWFGLVQRISPMEFLVKDVFILKQKCSAGTTEVEPKEIADMMMSLVEGQQLDLTKQSTEGIYLWGHSHHTMGVTGSGQDDAQFKYYMDQKPPFFIRMISNKAGLHNISLYLRDMEVTVSGLDFQLHVANSDEIAQQISAEIKAKVSKFGYHGGHGGTGRCVARVWNHATQSWDEEDLDSWRARTPGARTYDDYRQSLIRNGHAGFQGGRQLPLPGQNSGASPNGRSSANGNSGNNPGNIGGPGANSHFPEYPGGTPGWDEETPEWLSRMRSDPEPPARPSSAGGPAGANDTITPAEGLVIDMTERCDEINGDIQAAGRNVGKKP